MITLYKPNETDFTHNGIGVLDKHIYSATVEEELNGLFVLILIILYLLHMERRLTE
ncbi:hypothetical protein HFP64_00195 [Bacillus sp. AC79A.1]